MRHHRFIGAFNLTQSDLRLFDPDLVHQWTHVLRFQVGETVVLCDGMGREAEAEIVAMDKRSVNVRLGKVRPSLAELPTHLTLYCALIKRESFELIIQKATELGVAKIVPMVTRRTVKPTVRLDRLTTIAREAAEQCGRGVVPTVHEPQTFVQALKDTKKNDITYFFDIGAPELSASKAKTDRRGIFIGPEGGWDPEEVALAKKEGCQIVGLGGFVLRAETAGIAAVYEVRRQV